MIASDKPLLTRDKIVLRLRSLLQKTFLSEMGNNGDKKALRVIESGKPPSTRDKIVLRFRFRLQKTFLSEMGDNGDKKV